MKFRDFLRILAEEGFREIRVKGSHHQYEGIVDGKRFMVTVDFAQPGQDIPPRNLASMIRQSGLPKSKFR